jgi:hypothetical protein
VTFNWDPEKNALLKGARGKSFEEIVVAIEGGDVLDVLSHPNQVKYPNQQVYLVEYMDYVFVVPFVRDDANHQIVLKTIYPSRKFTKRYLRKDHEYEQDR